MWAPILSSQSVVLDLGANIGNFSHRILRHYKCQCYAVEANPDLCRAIPTHPKLAVYNLAMAASTGKLPLYLSTNSEATTLLPTNTSDKYRTIEVDAIRLEEFLALAGLSSIDLVKFDIEGAEIEVLDSSNDELLSSIGQLTIEFHDFLGLTPVATVERIVQRLDGLGFYPIKMWRRGWGDTLFVNRRLPLAKPVALAWSRYVTRNWWGVQRSVRRAAG